MMRYLYPIIIAAGAVYDLLCMWLRSFDRDIQEGDKVSDQIICWGTCRSLNQVSDFRYFVIRFPFISQWRDDLCRDRLCWHSPALIRFAGRWKCFWYPSDVGVWE